MKDPSRLCAPVVMALLAGGALLAPRVTCSGLTSKSEVEIERRDPPKTSVESLNQRSR